MKMHLLVSPANCCATSRLINYSVSNANKNNQVLYVNTELSYVDILERFNVYVSLLKMESTNRIHIHNSLDFLKLDTPFDVIVIDSSYFLQNNLNDLLSFIRINKNKELQLVIRLQANRTSFNSNGKLGISNNKIPFYINSISYLDKYKIDTYIEYNINPITCKPTSTRDIWQLKKHCNVPYLCRVTEDKEYDYIDQFNKLNILRHGYNIENPVQNDVLKFVEDSKELDEFVKNYNSHKVNKDDTINEYNLSKYMMIDKYKHNILSNSGHPIEGGLLESLMNDVRKDNVNGDVMYKLLNDMHNAYVDWLNTAMQEFTKNYQSSEPDKDKPKPFNWKEQLETNRNTVFPSRFIEDACTLIIKQQEEIEKLKSILTKIDTLLH
jgi:hypothetical protein